jgi:hypothetical protein
MHVSRAQPIGPAQPEPGAGGERLTIRLGICRAHPQQGLGAFRFRACEILLAVETQQA